MSRRHGFFVGVSPVQILSFLPASMSPSQVRLAGFIAVSIALHLLTVLGIGPLNLSARRIGDAPGRPELHATLVPGDSAQAAPSFSQASNETETARDTAPELARGDTPAHPGPTADDAGLALPAPDKWYTAREVDVRAEPMTDVRLRYPEHLRNEPVAGKVQLRIFIDERGVVRKIQIAASQPPGMFDESAKQAWEDVRFSPAIKNGAPVKSQKLLELTYQPGLI
jgi:protein TonB